ncbi:MAG TPA: hypothetical protein VGO16_18765 [Pseudonocardiaceae bacterium]|nr:hypothetical protein [Pseudonocardiaceae bacterium]
MRDMVAGPGRTHGQPLSQSRVSALLNGAEQFSAFMHDYRDTAATTTLAEPGWLRLGAPACRVLPARRKTTPVSAPRPRA